LSDSIELLIQADKKKWVEFMDQFHPLIFGTLRKYISSEEVEDSTQQVYLALIEKDYYLLKKFPRDSFPAFIVFLQRVSKNIALRILAKNQKTTDRWHHFEEKHNQIHDKRFNIEIEFSSKLENEEMNQEINRLDIIYREVMLYKLDGYKNREISQILNLPEKTVQTRLGRARAKLKKTGKFEGI
jgi:RNA polymerase sigma factor (sigma-70 family)